MRSGFLLLTVLATATAHAQWTLQTSHTTASLRGIHSLGNGVAWASGTEGTVLRTTDEGVTWQPCAVPPGAEALDFRGVQGFDADTAIVMSSGLGDLSRLYKTTDGCQSWTLLFTNPDKDGFWDEIGFADKGLASKDKGFGVLLGDPVDDHFVLFLTYDSGQSWERQIRQSPAIEPDGEAVFAASNSSLIVNGLMDRQFVTGGKGGARKISFWVGVDDTNQPNPRPAPRGWQVEPLPAASPADTSGAFSIAEEGNKAVIVGGDFAKPATGIAWYRDATQPETGPTWTASKTPPHGYRSAVAYDPSRKLWITVGPNGTDVSTDDGQTWHPIEIIRATRHTPTRAHTRTPPVIQGWNALSLPFVVGPQGRIGKLKPSTLLIPKATPSTRRPVKGSRRVTP